MRHCWSGRREYEGKAEDETLLVRRRGAGWEQECKVEDKVLLVGKQIRCC